MASKILGVGSQFGVGVAFDAERSGVLPFWSNRLAMTDPCRAMCM